MDVIEAGFPASSVGDFEAVHAIANAVTDVQVAALARCNKNDIDRAWQALNGARNPRIHVFLATSPIHMESQAPQDPDQVVEMAVAPCATPPSTPTTWNFRRRRLALQS